MTDLNNSNHIKTGRNDLLKQYIEYDGSSRMEYVYEARTAAKHGEACMKTQYVYDGASSRISKMKETTSTWDSDWDV